INPVIVTPHKPKYVRGVHLTAWIAGSPKLRAPIDKLLHETEINTVVIDIKEYEGEVYIPGVKQADQAGTFVKAIPDIEKYIADLKSRGVYTIARIVVFKDNLFPHKRPELGVKTTDGKLWKDHRGLTWLDPTNKANWDYNISIAERALELGFEEIQFDYIRFPSDGNIKACRYSVAHSTTSANQALVGFLKEAHNRLKPKGANISIDVFGLTTTVNNDMGIGQRIIDLARWVDFVSPMVYPSHYNPGEYGIANPDAAPYRIVYLGIEGAVHRLGEDKVRPYLQDFSLHKHYGAKEVRDQVQATYDNNVGEWLLWNPRCVYTRGGLKDKKFMEIIEKSSTIPREGKPVIRHTVAVSSTTLQTSAVTQISSQGIVQSTTSHVQ
ncbi:MAG: putative glycoside hydrolase, partial [Endomicrobiales bacterium]